MIRTIVLHELRMLLRDRASWLAAVLFGAAVGFAVSVGAAYQRSEQALVAERAEKRDRADRRRAEGVDEFLRSNPISSEDQWYALWSGKALSPDLRSKGMGLLAQTVGATSVHPSLPAPTLAALSIGTRDTEPTSAGVSIWNARQEMWGEGRLEHPANLLAGRFDLAFVLVYLYPLLIFVLGYDLLSSERERGTLPLLLSQSISLRSLLLGKLALRGGIAIAMGVGFAGLGTCLGVNAPLDASDIRRLVPGAALIIAYGTFWLALAAAVDCMGRASAVNAVILGVAWLAFVLLIPATIDLAINATAPVPSRMEWIQAHRRVSLEIEKQAESVLTAFLAGHPELAPAAGSSGPKNRAFAESHAVRVEAERRTRPIADRFERQLETQRRLLDRARFFIPTIVAQEGLDEIAGTSSSRHRRFRLQAEQFHREWLNYFVPKMFRNELMMPADHRSVPRFRFLEEPDGVIVGRIWLAAAEILGATSAIAALAWSRLRGYPVAGP